MVEAAAAEDAAPATAARHSLQAAAAVAGKAGRSAPPLAADDFPPLGGGGPSAAGASSGSWASIVGGGASSSAPPTPSLRFASYNVLAQSLLAGNAQNYGTCAADALRAELRLPRVLAAAVALDADVVGMQEVEDFEDVFVPTLAAHGYRGAYKQRTGAEKTDGCALFWRHEALELEHLEAIEMRLARRRRHARGRGAATPQGQRRAVGRLPRAAQRAPRHRRLPPRAVEPVARPREAPADPEVHARAAPLAATAGAAVVLLGDFNCTPRSELYGFLVDGALAAELSGEDGWDGQQPTWTKKSKAKGGGGGERWIEEEHALRGRLRSAYVAARGAEPPATSWHQGFRGTVDYVLYEAAALRPTALLPTPGWATLESLGGALPTAAHPSDHVPVAADLAWVADAPAAPEGAPALPPPEPGVIAATAAMVGGDGPIVL